MKKKYLLGYDIGSSSVKASLLSAESCELISTAFSPKVEMKIESPKSGWAEQHPENWWHHLKIVTKSILSTLNNIDFEILAIGISYQMHGLVMVDEMQKIVHPSIIWCDSRAVEIGNAAFQSLGSKYCFENTLNSPGNFTASKLKWVKDNLPEIYQKIHKLMLPGDYIAMKMSGKMQTTIGGLSEGILWDFKNMQVSEGVLSNFGIDFNLLPEVVENFSEQCLLSENAAKELDLSPGIPITYRAGDQPNNALSLNVLHPNEIAATAGTSGVIYGISEKPVSDEKGRVNAFAHVNYTKKQPNIGVLLCINGTGIQYSWLKQTLLQNTLSYEQLNTLAEKTDIGAKSLYCFPYGNGAERSLENAEIGAHFSGINFNTHTIGHLVRAAKEGIVFSFQYGFEIMKNMGINSNIIRAGNSNLFQSKLFKEAFVNTTNVKLEIYNTDGSQGAARGAGIGVGYYKSNEEAFKGLKVLETIEPETELIKKYKNVYNKWREKLDKQMM